MPWLASEGRERMGTAGQALFIDRPRLETAMASASLVLLEAPGGYGKSTAVQSLGRRLDRATVRITLRNEHGAAELVAALAVGARRAGLPLLAEALNPDEPDGSLDRLMARLDAMDPLLLAVDEVHRAGPDAADWLARFASDGLGGHALAVSGRRLPPVLRRLPEQMDAVLLGPDELRFSTDEIARIMEMARGHAVDAADVTDIVEATDGWPAAVVVAARAGIGQFGLAHRGENVLRDLIDRLLEGAPEPVRVLIATVAKVPLLSAQVCEILGGPNALDRILDTGLPVRIRPDGWAELPNPVRELIAASVIGRATQLDLHAARAVAAEYADRGELGEAATLLQRLSDSAGIAELLATQPRGRLTASALTLYEPILEHVADDDLRANPGALVQLVRSADKMPRLRQRWIDRATGVVPAETPPGRAILAEQALELARAGDFGASLRLARSVLAAAGPDELTTRGRAHFCRALCLLLQDAAGASDDVRSEFEMAISRFHLAGERDWEAEALQALGYGVYFTTGAFEAAADALERALALRPGSDAARAETLTVLAEVVTYMGRLDDADVALREARGIARRLGDERTLGYVAWSSAELAATRRDREAAIAALEEAERHPGVWFPGLAGIDFLSHASEIRAVVGDRDGAWRALERAEAKAAGTARDGEPLSARVRLETMYGDPATALGLLDGLEVSPFVYPNDRWLHPLMRAACRARLGDRDSARAQLRLAEQICAEQGDPSRPVRREPELLALADPASAPAPEPSALIVTLGRFAVERGGQDVSPQSGRPQTLVKLLAVKGHVTVDEAIDELWPDADLDTGRGRLRNLLNRVRAAAGDVVVRTDGSLSLGPAVVVDAARFEAEAAAAIAAPPDTRAGLARAALARSTGEFLPGDHYSDWASVPRERLRRRHLALLDIVSADAIARGDFDEADRLLDEAITVDPLDEVRYVKLAQALSAQGRLTRARRVAEQALSMAEELGVEASDELARLMAQLQPG